MPEGVGLPVPHTQAASVGTDQDLSVRILQKGIDEIGRQTAGLVRFGRDGTERTLIFIQNVAPPFSQTDPHPRFLIGRDRIYRLTGEIIPATAGQDMYECTTGRIEDVHTAAIGADP